MTPGAASSEEQQVTKLNNLLTEMRRKGQIFTAGSGRGSLWMLAEKKE